MNNYIQVFLAILIVIVLFITAMMVYNKEQLKAIKETGTIKKVIPIFSGIVDFSGQSDVVYNTIEPNAPNYINMGPSINQNAGAAYSYNFWLYIDNTDTNAPIFYSDTTTTNTAQLYTDSGLTPTPPNEDDLPFILFLRGSNQVLEYKNSCSTSDKTSPETNAQYYKQDVLVKAPLVKLEHNGTVLTVEFNTLKYPDGLKAGSRDTCQDIDINWYFINQYKVGLKNLADPAFSKKWFMITIVLQDTLPTDPFPIRNKIRSQIYVNGTIEMDKYIIGRLADPTNKSSSPLRVNQGNVFLNPTLYSNPNGSPLAQHAPGTPVSMTRTNNRTLQSNPHKLMMADLTYFNYALQSLDVASLYTAKFNKSMILVGTSADQSYLNNISTNTDPNVKLIAP